MLFDKEEIRENLQLSDIFELLTEWGGEPEYVNTGIVSSTICHNKPGEGSRKLYYYENSTLFKCYTDCDESFDIFDLTTKVMEIQRGVTYSLGDSIKYIAFRFGFLGKFETDNVSNGISQIEKDILGRYSQLQEIAIQDYHIALTKYDDSILKRFNYNVKLIPWECEDKISREAINLAQIGYYSGGAQITIPHFDINGNFIGLRGRTVIIEDAQKYGKYRPIIIGKTQYSHPLSMNLYGLNLNKTNIKNFKKAIIFEGEKSVLLYETLFGREANIATACCGSSISFYQIQLLLDLGVEEIIIAFDRQFQEINDDEYHKLTNNLIKIQQKYRNYATISIIFDKNKITHYKASPIDEGKEKFLTLLNDRIYL